MTTLYDIIRLCKLETVVIVKQQVRNDDINLVKLRYSLKIKIFVSTFYKSFYIMILQIIHKYDGKTIIE